MYTIKKALPDTALYLEEVRHYASRLGHESAIWGGLLENAYGFYNAVRRPQAVNMPQDVLDELQDLLESARKTMRNMLPNDSYLYQEKVATHN